MLKRLFSLSLVAAVLFVLPPLLPRSQASPAKAGEEREEKEATNALQAMLWRRRQLMDEHGKIDPQGFVNALKQRQRVLTVARKATTPGLIGQWTFRGPHNVGGRTRSLLVLNGGTTLLAGSVSGGLWRSTDSGTTWAPINDQMANLAIDCLAQDPLNPGTIYAGTGEGFFNIDAVYGQGIFKSTDGGSSWVQLPNTVNFGSVCRIAVHPQTPNILLASTLYGGIRRSTDGGNTWTTVKVAQGSMDVVFHPTNPNRVLAHVIDYSGGWFHQAFSSNDAGASWQAIPGIPIYPGFTDGRMEFAFAPSNPQIAYMTTAGDGGRVWKSVDAGATFVQVTPNPVGLFTWYTNFVWVDPTNPNIVVVPGGPHKSVDGGVTFQPIGSGYILTNQPHPDVHFGTNGPTYNGIADNPMYVCTDGGVFRAPNLYAANTSSGWEPLYRGYDTTQFYSADGDLNAGIFVGGLQDNGTLRTTVNSTDAHMMYGGDGGFVAIDHQNPNYIYSEYINLDVVRSTDGGNSAGEIRTGLGDALANANFIAPLVLDQNQPTTLLGGGSQLWRTTNARDAQPTWGSIRGPGSDKISAIEIASGNSNNIWVGQNNGIIEHTTNGTAGSPTWVTGDPNNTLPKRYVQRIRIDPSNPNRVYACLGGFASDNLWVSNDSGGSWTRITGTGNTALPASPIRDMAIHPVRPNWIYAATVVGIFASTDGGATWQTTNMGPAAVDINELKFLPNSAVLLAGTHGRGMWTINLSVQPILSDFTLSRGGMIGGNTVAATVTFQSKSIDNGSFSMASSNSSVIPVPRTVPFTTGDQGKSVVLISRGVGNTVTVTISATLGNTTMSKDVIVRPATLSSVEAASATVPGGAKFTSRVFLTGAPPPGGVTVPLSTSSGLLVVPSTAKIGAASKYALVYVQSKQVSANTSASFSATYLGVTKTATVTLVPATIRSIGLTQTFNPGGTSYAVLYLDGLGSAGGTSAALSVNTTLAAVPKTVTVPAGKSGQSFAVTAHGVASTVQATITATRGSKTVKAVLALVPATLSSATTSTASLHSNSSATGRVYLDGLAPPNGAVVKIVSSSSAVTVPKTVTVTYDHNTNSFPIRTGAVTGSEEVQLTLTYGLKSKYILFHISP